MLLAILLASCAKPPTLPVFSEIPQFDLVAQSGQPFDSRSLDGHIWIADFIFTTCTNVCPLMSNHMRRVQQATAGTPEVKLVSFTVDPANDTPAVLAEYAQRYKADPARWTFLTGEIARLNDLGLNAFKLNPVDGKRDPSPRFVLIDRRRRIGGYYLSGDDGFPSNLLRDLRLLQKESS
jgi:protein SCO1/2